MKCKIPGFRKISGLCQIFCKIQSLKTLVSPKKNLDFARYFEKAKLWKPGKHSVLDGGLSTASNLTK